MSAKKIVTLKIVNKNYELIDKRLLIVTKDSIKKCIKVLNKNQAHDLTLVRVPGHNNIEGNDQANECARKSSDNMRAHEILEETHGNPHGTLWNMCYGQAHENPTR